MTFTVDLTPEETRRIQNARTKGIDVTALFKGIIASLPDEVLPEKPEIEDKTLELLAQWREEDATEDTEELERRDVELEEFKTNLQNGRLSLPVPGV